MTHRCFLGCAILALWAVGCGDDSGCSGGSGSGSAGAGSNCPEVSDNFGGEACESETCAPGEYCEGFTCTPGCENANTCPEGMYCDLSGADSTNAGTCRTPPDECSGGNGSGAGTDTGSGTGSGSGTGGGPPPDCEERCADKLVSCNFQEQVDDVPALCGQICGALNDETLQCLEDASCGALADGNECGVPLGEGEEGGSQGGS